MKKPIRILSQNFELLGEIGDYESLQFTRRYYSAGEFELHININKNNGGSLQKGNLIILGNDTHKVGIIRHREISEAENETLMVTGFTLSSILEQRITIPPSGQAYDSFNSNAEAVIKHYVDANCITPVDAKRIIPQLVLAPNKSIGVNISWQSRLKQLDLEIENVSTTAELGWEVYLDLDKKKYVFDVYQGRNLTVNQDLLPPVIFSPDFYNMLNQHYVDSSKNYKNFGYIGGQGEGDDRTIVEVGDLSSGLDRYEIFIDARDINENEDLHERGIQKLNEYGVVQTLECQVIPQGSFTYEKDWNLGDIVTIQNKKWGITMDTRITEVKEIYETDGFKVEPVFGNSIPTLITYLKQELGQISGEITK